MTLGIYDKSFQNIELSCSDLKMSIDNTYDISVKYNGISIFKFTKGYISLVEFENFSSDKEDLQNQNIKLVAIDSTMKSYKIKVI